MEDNSRLQEENIGEDNGSVNPLFGVRSEEEAGGGFTGRTISEPSRFKKFEPQVDYDNEEIRAELQSGWELAKGFANQAVVGEVLGGSIEGVGNLLDIGDYMTSSMDVEDDLGTYIKEAGQSLRTWSQEATPIHRTEDARGGWSRFSDPTYWTSMGPSIASTLSLMIPAAGTARAGMAAINKLGQLSKLGRVSGRARQLTEGIGMAFASRHMENAMEASQVYQEEYRALRNQGLSEAKARDAAGRGAAHTYRLGYMNLATDIPQYLTLLKGADKINSSLREAMENLTAGQAVRQSAAELSEDITRAGVGEIAKRAGQQALSEAGEEAAQFVYQQEGKRVSEEASDLRRTEDAVGFSERVKQYTENPEFWDSALFGALGGVLFDSVGRVIRDRIDSSRAEQQKKDLQRTVSRLQGVRGHLEDVSKAAAAGSQEDIAASLEKLGERMALDAASRDVAEREQQMFENIAQMSDEELQQSGFEDPQAARENAQWMAEKMNAVRDEYEQNMATSAAVVAQDADRRGEDIGQDQLQDRASIFNTRLTELKTAIDRLQDQRRQYELRANETENQEERQRLETAAENIEQEINTREEELRRLTEEPEARDQLFDSIQQQQERQDNLQNEVEDTRESSANRDQVSQSPTREDIQETEDQPEVREDEDALRVLEGDLDVNEIDPSAGRDEPVGPPPEVQRELEQEERRTEQPDITEEGEPPVPDPEEADELPFDDTEEVSDKADEILTAQEENINPAKHDDTLSKGPEEGDENANLEDTEDATEPSEQPSAQEQAEEPDDEASIPVPESEEDIDAPPIPEREQEYVDDTANSRDDDFEIPDYTRQTETSPAPRTFFATTMSGYHQLRSEDPIDRASAQFFEDTTVESLENLESIELEAAPYSEDYIEDIDPDVEDTTRGTRGKISDLLDAIRDNAVMDYEVDSDSQAIRFKIGGDTPFVTSITLTFEEIGEVPLRGYPLDADGERINYKGYPVRTQLRRIKKILEDSRYDINEGDPEVESYARTRAEIIASLGNENITRTTVPSKSTQMTGVLNYESEEDVRNRLSEVFEEVPTVGYAESTSKVITDQGEEITGLNVTPGAMYAIVNRPDGRTQFPIRLKSRRLTDREAEVVYESYRQLIDDGRTETDTFDASNLNLSSEDEFSNATINDVLESLVFKGKATENFQDESTTLFKDQGRVRLGNKTFTPDNIGQRKAEFINYLRENKNAHVNKDIIRQDQPIREFTVLGRSTASGLSFYTEGDNPAIATDVRTGEDAPYQRLFKNPTIRFGETVQSNDRSSKPIAHETDQGPPQPQEKQFDAEIEAQTEEGEEISTDPKDRFSAENASDTDTFVDNSKTEGDEDAKLFSAQGFPESFNRINAQSEAEWIRDRLPKEINVETVQGLLDFKQSRGTEAFGAFTDGMEVILSEDAPRGTGYHEAFHAVFNGVLEPSERQQVIEDAREQYTDDPSTPQIEERLAEQFRRYVQSEGDERLLFGEDSTDSFFQRIWKWMKELVGLDTLTVNKLFKEIDQGTYSDRQVLDRSSRTFRTRMKEVPGFNPKEIREVLSSLAYYTAIVDADILGEGEITDINISPDNLLEHLESRGNFFMKQYQETSDKSRQEMYDTIMGRIAKVMDNIDEFSELLEEYYQEKFEIDPTIENTGADQTQELGDIEAHVSQPYEHSGKDTATATMRLFIGLQPEIQGKNENGQWIFDTSGYLASPQFNEFGRTWNKIERALSNIRRYKKQDGTPVNEEQQFIRALKEKSKKVGDNYKDPTVRYIAEQFEQMNPAKRTQFVQAFRKADQGFFVGLWDRVTEEGESQLTFDIGSGNVDRESRVILDEWNYQFTEDLSVDRARTIINAYSQGERNLRDFTNNLQWPRDRDTTKIESAKDTLYRFITGPMNLEISEEGLQNIIDASGDNPVQGIQNVVEGLQWLIDPDNNRAKNNGTNIWRVLNDDSLGLERISGGDFLNQSVMRRLARGEARANEGVVESTVLGPDNNMYWSYSQFNELFSSVNKISKRGQLFNRLRNKLFTQKSRWLQQIAEKDSVADTFSVKTYLNMRNRSNNSAGEKYHNLRPADKLIFDINSVLKELGGGRSLFPSLNMSDKSTKHFITGPEIIRNTINFEEGLGDIELNDAVIEKMTDYLFEEFKRIRIAENEFRRAQNPDDSLTFEDLTQYYHYKEQDGEIVRGRAFELTDLFENLSYENLEGTQLGEALYNSNGLPKEVHSVNDLQNGAAELRSRITDTIVGEIESTIEEMRNARLIADDSLSYNRESGDPNKFLNRDIENWYSENIAANENEIILNAVSDFTVNQLIADIEQQYLFHGDIKMYKTRQDVRKRNPMIAAYGSHLNMAREEVSERYNIMLMDDVITESPYFRQWVTDYLENRIRDNNPDAEITDDVMDSLRSAVDTQLNEETTGLGEEMISLSEDIQIDPADIRDVINTLGPYRAIEETDAQGYITPERFREIMIGLGRWNSQKQEAYEVLTDENADRQEAIEKSRQADLKFYALKGVHGGLNHERYDNRSVPTYLKYSQATLFPALTEGTELDGLRKFMENNDIDEAVYNTGVKVGGKNPQQAFDENGRFVGIDSLNDNVMSLSNDQWKLQVETQPHGYEEVLIGSQPKKNIFSNLDPERTYEIDGREMDGHEAQRFVNDLLSSMVEMDKISLFGELGVEMDDNGRLRIKNFESLVDTVKQQLNRRGAANSVKESISLNANGFPEAPFSASPSKNLIENILFSVIRDRIVQNKVRGGAMVQMSGTGFSNDRMIDWSELDREERNNTEVIIDEGKLVPPHRDENGNLVPGSVFLPSYFKDAIPQADQLSQEEMREYFSDNPELLEALMYRIPNQAKSSIDIIQVAGFLPEEVGDVVVPYNEITAKTGSDFDIDKLWFMLPRFEINEEGDPQLVEFKDNFEDSIEAYNDWVFDRAADSIKRDVSEEMYSEAQSVETRIDEVKANWSRRATQRDIEDDLFDKAKLMDNISPLSEQYFTNILRDVASTYNEIDISQGHPDRIATFLGRIDEQIEIERRNSRKTSDKIIRGLENLRSSVEEAHRRSRQIEEQTEEVTEEEFEQLTNRAENLWDSMRSRVASAVASRQNLPTMDEWMELPIEQRNIRPALENKMLRTFREILSADDIYEESIYPLDAANQRLKSIAERVRSEEGRDILEMSGRNQRKQNNVFTSGKQMVGIVANHIVHHPLAQTGGISLDITQGEPGRGSTLGTEEDTEGTVSLDKIRDENGDRITITLSAILNGSVDVAKDPWIFDLNMNLFTANSALTLIRSGRSPEFTFNFINQPIINEFQDITETYEAESINRVPVEDGPGYKSPEDIVKENYEEPSETQKEQIRNQLDDIEFLREQRENPTDAAQWVILDEFQFIQGLARDLGDSIQLARVEPQGAGKSLADRLSAEMLKDSVMSDDNATFNNDLMMHETFIGDVYDNTVDIANDLVRDVMIEATPAFETAVAQMINESGVRARDIQTIGNIMKELYSYVLADSPISFSNEEIQEHFFSDNSMAHELADLKRDDSIEDNMLIDYLTYEINDGENTPSFIKGRSSNINSVEKDLITDDWKNLLESDNERLRTFAEDLVSYAYHTSGMRKGVFTFHDFIPPSYLKSSGVNEHLNEKISEFSDPLALSEAIASVYKHNYDDNTLVPRVPTADLLQVVDRTNGIPTRVKITKKETIELEGGETRETTTNLLQPHLPSNKENPPYIKFRYTRTDARGRVVGSQTILMQREPDGEYYRRVQKLGYREAGRKIYEHSTDEDVSAIPSNDPDRYASTFSPFSVDRTTVNTGTPNTQGDNSVKPVGDGPTTEYESVEEAEEDIQTEDEGFNPPEVTELFGDTYADQPQQEQQEEVEQTEETEETQETEEAEDEDSRISDIMEGQERTDQMREDGRFPAPKSSRARAKNYLMSQGVIDRYLNVKDYQQAVETIGPLNKRYREQYDLPENLFHFIKGGKEITLNRNMFNLIDAKRGLGRSEPSVLDSNISYLFDEDQVRQASDIISDIQEQSDSDLMSELASMLEDYVPVNNVEIGFLTDPEAIQDEFVEGDVEYAGFYYSGSGRITINTQTAGEDTVLHEIIHAFTQEEVEASGSSVAQLREFYEEIIEDEEFQNMYATQDLSEFIAGIFTDPELIRKLKDTQAVGIEESPTLWDRVVELITQLFVDNPSDREITAFEEGMSLTIDVLESSRKRAEAMHMTRQDNLNNRIRREIC